MTPDEENNAAFGRARAMLNACYDNHLDDYNYGLAQLAGSALIANALDRLTAAIEKTKE